jgi:hypothetical protein
VHTHERPSSSRFLIEGKGRGKEERREEEREEREEGELTRE